MLTAMVSAEPEMTAGFDKLPVPGMVTMIDLGAKKCIPCKMMAPILVKLEKEYSGRAAIVFIDVWENNEQAYRFKIQSIPTQIFFDADGREVFRHSGFLSEEKIKKALTQLGVTS
ncbi:MAG: thioredoxin family protein [Pseudomonadota bacterium]